MPSPFATNASLFRFIRAAQAAPSVHNTQPWSFWVRADDRIELRANWKRYLAVADPRARELTISCGAALFNLRIALRAAGYEPVVWLVPDPNNDPDLLACVEAAANKTPRPAASEQRLYDAIPQRHTNRGPFTGPAVPMNIITELGHAARREQAYLRLLHPRAARTMLRAVAKADRELAADQAYVQELRQWTGDATPSYGVPAAAFGPLPRKPLPGRMPAPVRDLGLGRPGIRPVERFEKRARLLVLSTEHDRPQDWLRAGQALERVLLTATRRGVATSLLSQPFEIKDRHWSPAQRRPPGYEYTHMVIRLGYGPPIAVTPRAADPDVVDCRLKPPLPVRMPEMAPAVPPS